MANTSPCHSPSAWQRSPSLKSKILIFSRCFIFLIDRATQKVPIKKYLKEIVVQVFEIYASELLGSLPTDEV